MDAIAIAAAGMAGVLGGIVGAVLARGSTGVRAGVRIALPALLLGAATGLTVHDRTVHDVLVPPTRIERIAREFEPELARSLRRRYGRAPGDAAARAGELSHRGLRRLSDADLLRWNRLRIQLATENPALCAGFWRGDLTEAQLTEALDGLSDADLHAWVELSTTAARLEAERAAWTDPGPEALVLGVRRVAARLAPDERARFLRTAEAAATAAPDDACFALQRMLVLAERLPEAERAPFLRALAAL